jgi:hypothetical protein
MNLTKGIDMKHIHRDKIVAWADDTNQIILYKKEPDNLWLKSYDQDLPSWHHQVEYFLVPEKHVEVALHWLNGGKIESLCDS